MDGLVLLLPGLLVQVMSPATHTAFPPRSSPTALDIVANVAMMCGCPINDAPPSNPWVPGDFHVSAQSQLSTGNVGTGTVTFFSNPAPS